MHRLAVSKIFVDWYSKSVLAKQNIQGPSLPRKIRVPFESGSTPAYLPQ